MLKNNAAFSGFQGSLPTAPAVGSLASVGRLNAFDVMGLCNPGGESGPGDNWFRASLRFVTHFSDDEGQPRRDGVLALPPNEPNPFSGSTTIRFALPVAGPVTLSISDDHGRIVRKLVDEHMEAGWYQREWDGCDHDGKSAAPGIYTSSLQTPRGLLARKMVRV